MIESDYATRSDAVETKINLLRAALNEGRYELAQALADSIKEGIAAERQLRARPGEPTIPAAASRELKSLPAPWAEWARGWSRYQVIVLQEPLGLARQREPVDLFISVPAEEVACLAREARLARLDRQAGTLREIPCQVYGEVRRGSERLGHLVPLMRLRPIFSSAAIPRLRCPLSLRIFEFVERGSGWI